MANYAKQAGKTVLVLLLITAGTASAANLYRWFDDQGDPVVSDRPPAAGVEYEVISTDASVVRRMEDEPPPTPVTSKPRPPAGAPAPATPSRSVYKKNPEYCANARKNLEVIENSARIRVADDNGDMRYITDEERAIERQKNLDVIETHCE